MAKNKDKCLGAYIGAAIGDAMGGPVECNHYARIRKYVGEVDDLLPYQKPYSLIELQPGYALYPEAGNITDDTFIRKDLTLFYLQTKPPRTPQMLADWLWENADLKRQWPDIMVQALVKVKSGKSSADTCGLTFKQGGGIGWWTPTAIVHAGDPEGAAADGRNLSRIWKAPLEQDLLAATVAGMAEGMNEGATWESMVEAMLAQCTGSLSTGLLTRAIDVGESSRGIWDLADKVYHNLLMPDHTISPYKEINEYDPPTDVNGPMPEKIVPIDYSDKAYTTCFFAEQIPLSLASFVFAKGEPGAIGVCCSLGRDCDTTATTVGGWVGALNGESGLPKKWVDTVCEINLREIDIRDLAEQIYAIDA